MRHFTTLIAAVILMATGLIFTLASDANAKTAFIAYGSKSLAPNGAFSNWDFNGDPAFGAGIRFGMDGRFSFGLDYISQKMNRRSIIRGPIALVRLKNNEISWVWQGMTAADLRHFEISQDDLSRLDSLVYTENSESGLFNVITTTLYVSLTPKNGSRLIVEPVVGFIGGVSIGQNRINYRYYYEPELDNILGYHFQFSDDNGSGYSRETKYTYKPLAGMSFGLNFFPVENIIVAPEIRYLYNFGFNIRTGIGVAF